MKVTNISIQKTKNNRCNLDIDGQFYCGIDSSLLVDLDLYQGKEIDKTIIDKICQHEEYKKCLDRAYNILSIRMNSGAELERKLSVKFSKSSVIKVMQRLKELGYLDDLVFAKCWVDSRKTDRGKYTLEQELRQKRVSMEIVEIALSDCTVEEEVENARKLIEKKHFTNLSRDEKFKKVSSLLSRRGFSYSVIKKALEE